MIHKVVDYLIWVFIMVVLVFVGWLASDCFYPPMLLKFDSAMISIARDYTHSDALIQIFHPGDIVPLRMKGTKYTGDIPISIGNKLVREDAIIALPSSSPQPKGKGKFDFVDLSRRVPLDCPVSGVVYMEITFVYSRNFIVDHEVYKVRTEPFRIKK